MFGKVAEKNVTKLTELLTKDFSQWGIYAFAEALSRLKYVDVIIFVALVHRHNQETAVAVYRLLEELTAEKE